MFRFYQIKSSLLIHARDKSQNSHCRRRPTHLPARVPHQGPPGHSPRLTPARVPPPGSPTRAPPPGFPLRELLTWVRQCWGGDSAAALVPKASHPGLRGPGCKWPLGGLRESSHVHTGLPLRNPGCQAPDGGALCVSPDLPSEPPLVSQQARSLGNPGQRVRTPCPIAAHFPSWNVM